MERPRHQKAELNRRRVRFDLISPELSRFGIKSGTQPSQTQLSFWDKKSLSRLYGRSSESRFKRPLTPNEIGIIHLIVQQQVLQDDVVRVTRELLGLNPHLFYKSGILEAEAHTDPRFIACLDYLDDQDRLAQTLPEVFGGKTNEHHVIPRSLKSDFRTGRKHGNTLDLNSKFHTRHWHSLYLNRDPQRIERMLYFELGFIQTLSERVQGAVSQMLSADAQQYYKPRFVKNTSS